MNFNTHFDLEGKHSFLSPSSYSWLNYDEDKLRDAFISAQARERGTELHALAANCIRLGVKLPRNNKTLNAYVNDAIGYRMITEQPLYYSRYCFGHADAISFENNFLRIHDLKTGVTPAKMEQLMIYTALFCLEYGIRPSEIDCELRIYQNDAVMVYNPAVDEIVPIMDKIVQYDKILNKIDRR